MSSGLASGCTSDTAGGALGCTRLVSTGTGVTSCACLDPDGGFGWAGGSVDYGVKRWLRRVLHGVLGCMLSERGCVRV
jgi:hypothetical protein